jgi:thiamine-monophosphate kinase
MDMLVEGRHFLAGADPVKLGHKCLAVNLSDLAAMGARPVAFTLALALPRADAAWLEGFARGLLALADEHGCELIGGDTTKGPLTVCITVFGELAPDTALRRGAARPGDDVWISGTLGDARLALALYRQEIAQDAGLLEACADRMHAPTPRVALGMALAGVAHAAIDVSDGLTGDLGHILAASGVGAVLDADALPAGPALLRCPRDLRRRYGLAGGDDYELCFTAAQADRERIAELSRVAGTAVTRIGAITAEPGLRFIDANGAPLPFNLASFDHFTTP